MTDKIHLPSSQRAANGGVTSDVLSRRDSAIEDRMNLLATKPDVMQLEAIIARRYSSMNRWLIGILTVVCGSLVVELVVLLASLRQIPA